jgi:hypothetical protein
MKTPLTLALVAAVVVPVGIASQAQAMPATDPTTLARGADPQLTWLGGRTIHTASGREVAVPVKAGDAAYLRLLGKSQGQWVVVDGGYKTRVLAIRGGHARTVWSRISYEPATGYTLARGGDTVLQWYTDRGGTESATVFDLSGKKVATHTWGNWGEVLDFVGDRAILSFRHSVSWTPGTTPVQIAGYTGAADIERDLLFVADKDYRWGPTSLSAPGLPPWTASFSPRSVSPDGQWVAGFNVRMNKLQVRSMADGSLAPVSVSQTAGDALAWEPDGHVIVGVRTDLGNALVRCSVTGGCELATDWLKGQAVNLPYSPQAPEDY